MAPRRSNAIRLTTSATAGMGVFVAVVVGCRSVQAEGVATVQGRPAEAIVIAPGDELGFLEGLLVDGSVPSAFRQEAAARLARSGTEDAALILQRSLDGGDASRRDIVAEGLKSAGALEPPVARVVAESAASGRLGPDLAATVLSSSGEVGSGEVIDLFGRESELERRLRLIEVLGRMPDPVAAGVLVGAIQDTSDPVEAAAIDTALQRWSNSRVVRTPAAWATWWNRLNVEGVGSVALRRLTNRIAQETARADAEVARAEAATRRADRLAGQLAEVYGRLLASLSDEARLELVQSMLTDEEPRVRAAAIGQVERQLRDGRVLPDALRRALLDRLGDGDSANRIQAAKVLDTMGVEEFGATLVRSLENEAEVQVVRAGLLVLGNRPHPEAAGFALDHLAAEDPETVRLAARVLATLSGAGLLHPDDRDRVRVEFEEGLAIEARETARLAVLVAADLESEAVTSLLRSPIESVQNGAAQAFRTKGRRELLHAARDRPAVARVAVQAWADPAGISAVSVERLLELRPDPGDAATADLETDLANWRAAMGRVLEAMPGSQLSTVAAQLRGSREFVEPRIASLRRGVEDPSLSTVERRSLHRSLADLLVEAGRPSEAVSELRAAGADGIDSPLRADLFDLLLTTADWEAAAAVEPGPEAWFDVLDREIAAGGEVDGLISEIERRFGDSLEESDRARLAGIRGGLASEPDDAERR